MEQEKIRILELVQWVKPLTLRNFNLASYKPRKYRGSPSSPARFRSIHYLVQTHQAKIMDVYDYQHPILGYVWYRQGPDGKLVKWKQNIDSSG
ncbi:hypothetical protein HYT45_03805 [Candidatus Uhrbacteria bacterium]|nr:hypothetical protein [Candidatus Uhrbacteria bacterium]